MGNSANSCNIFFFSKQLNMWYVIMTKSSTMSSSRPSKDLGWKTHQLLLEALGKIHSAKESLVHFVESVSTIWLFSMKSTCMIFCMNTSLNITMSAERICHLGRIRRFTALLKLKARLKPSRYSADCITYTVELLELKNRCYLIERIAKYDGKGLRQFRRICKSWYFNKDF